MLPLVWKPGGAQLEVMMYSLPWIGVERDAMPEIIQNSGTGWIIPGGDVPALTNCMLGASIGYKIK